MDGLFSYTLILLFIGYVLGIIFSQKTMAFIFWLIKKVKAVKLKEFIMSWNDWVFIGIALVTIIGLFVYLWSQEQILSKGDTIQLLIFLATFFTLFYSTVLKDKATQYRNRGIVNIDFDSNDTDLYHMTNMDVRANNVNIIASVPTYYVRLRVLNSGNETLNNVEVVVEKVKIKSKTQLQRPFLSLNLHWAFSIFENPTVVRIPQGMARIVDLFEVMEPQATQNLATTLNHMNNADWIRLQAMSEGFRTCTTKPNTLSDIYPFGDYEFHLSVSADNAEPIFAKILIRYNGNWSSQLNTMRSKNLKVQLLAYGNNREEIFS